MGQRAGARLWRGLSWGQWRLPCARPPVYGGAHAELLKVGAAGPKLEGRKLRLVQTTRSGAGFARAPCPVLGAKLIHLSLKQDSEEVNSWTRALPAHTSTSHLVVASIRNRKERTKTRGHERAPPEVSLQPRPALSSSSSGTGSWAVGLGESPAQSPWVQGMTSVSAGHKCHCRGTRGRKVAPHPGGPRQANDTTANKRIKATSQEAAWCQEKLMSSRRLPGLQGRLDISKTRQCLLSPRPWEDTHTSQLQHHSFCIWGN